MKINSIVKFWLSVPVEKKKNTLLIETSKTDGLIALVKCP
tara:strand:- start:2680 stop:2799 length:120 start_codon:yes stop_codon:yes gene_type:complete